MIRVDFGFDEPGRFDRGDFGIGHARDMTADGIESEGRALIRARREHDT